MDHLTVQSKGGRPDEMSTPPTRAHAHTTARTTARNAARNLTAFGLCAATVALWTFASHTLTAAASGFGASAAPRVTSEYIVGDGGLSLDDELASLYSTRMRIDEAGVPEVAIGLMETQTSVAFATGGATQIRYHSRFEGERVQKTLSLPKGGSFRVEARDGKAAEVAYYPQLATFAYGDAEIVEEARRYWAHRGVDTKTIIVGSVNGIRGEILDNRRQLLLADGPATREWAEQLRAKIFLDHGLQSGLFEDLLAQPRAKLVVIDENGKPVVVADDIIEVRVEDGSPATIRNVEYGRGYDWHGFEDRKFSGRFRVTPDKEGKLAVVNVLKLPDYLKAVVPMEIYATAPMEALKAQSIAAAGHVLTQLGARHIADPYHLCAHSHCQMYGGASKEKKRTNEAVNATRGLLLFRHGNLVDTVYSANSGGHTENNDVAWAQPPDEALRGRADLFGRTPFNNGIHDGNVGLFVKNPVAGYALASSRSRKDIYRWKRSFTAQKLDELLQSLNVGRVYGIEVAGRGVSGRIKAVRVKGSAREAIVQYEFPVRKLFNNLPSGLFTVASAKRGGQTVFEFQGAGWGHGVGMCQTGAIGRAEKKQPFTEILRHYYNGAEVRKLY